MNWDSRRGAFSGSLISISNGSPIGPSLRARSMYCSTDGQPSYTIRAGVAWDYIETKPALDRPPDLIYYGTAAQRSPANRPGLEHLLAAKPWHRLFDVNLRKDCYTPQTVLFGLEAATIVKLNDEEWEAVRDIAAVSAPADLLDRYALDCLAITFGSDGAQLHIPGASFAARPAPASVVDAVGAGDAFSGVLAASALARHRPATGARPSVRRWCQRGAAPRGPLSAARSRKGGVCLTTYHRKAFPHADSHSPVRPSLPPLGPSRAAQPQPRRCHAGVPSRRLRPRHERAAP